MAGPRPEKVAVVEEVREHLENSGAAILTEYRGLKVGDLAALRRQLRTAGADYKIFKNTLVRRATADTERSVIDPLLVGPTAIAFVRDDVGAVAKVLREFGRVHPALVVKGGLLGSKLLDARDAAALADLPSRDALLAQLAGGLAAPMQRFASLLQALPRDLAYGLSALVAKRREEGGDQVVEEPVAEAAAEPAEPSAEVTEPAEEPAAVQAEAEPAAVTEPAEEPAAVQGEAEPAAVTEPVEEPAAVQAEAEPAAVTEPAEPAEG